MTTPQKRPPFCSIVYPSAMIVINSLVEFYFLFGYGYYLNGMNRNLCVDAGWYPENIGCPSESFWFNVGVFLAILHVLSGIAQFIGYSITSIVFCSIDEDNNVSSGCDYWVDENHLNILSTLTTIDIILKTIMEVMMMYTIFNIESKYINDNLQNILFITQSALGCKIIIYILTCGFFGCYRFCRRS